jgi:hypothetical protein
MASWCLREVSPAVLIACTLLMGHAHAVSAHANPVAASMLASGMPSPILRGITVIEGDYARVYLEDPRTGIVTTYSLGDIVGDSRIEWIQDDRVVLRRGNDLVELRFGVPSTATLGEAGGPGAPPPRLAAGDGAATSAPRVPIQSEGVDAPIIGSGQPWLDKLGIPRGALSRAIESVTSSQESNSSDD